MAASLCLAMPAALFNPLEQPRKLLVSTPRLPKLCDSKFSLLNVPLELPRNGRIFSAIRGQSSPDYVPDSKFYKVEAIIRPWSIQKVSSVLLKMGIRGVTVSDVRGFGGQGGSTESYGGEKIPENLAVRPRVGSIMESNSEYPAMKAAATILKQFNVPYEIEIVSAHLTPNWVFSYASSACDRGLQIIIAVIGVPVRASAFDEVDQPLSIVKMHTDAPFATVFATVAINKSIDAGLLAVRILGISDFDILGRMSPYLENTPEIDDPSFWGETTY